MKTPDLYVGGFTDDSLASDARRKRMDAQCNRCRTWTPLYVNGLGTCADLGTAVAAHWGGTCPRFLREVGT